MARADDVERQFHEEWLGMVQPEGLVVSLPVLREAGCFLRNPPALQQRLKALVDDDDALIDPRALLAQILELPAERFDRGAALPQDLAHYHERDAVVPSAALRRLPRPKAAVPEDLVPDTATPQSRAGEPYELLVLELPDGIDPDKPDGAAWSYPPVQKLERLVRDTRVEIGLLLGRTQLRLVYAPHGQAPGWIDFSIAAMCDPGGRPILDALVMLLRGRRVDDSEWPLRRLLAESRERQANVTNALAKQVFEALQALLDGIQEAAADDDRRGLAAALAHGEQHVYAGLLTVMLRLVFVLYAEDRKLLPMDEPLYEEHLSLLRLFAQLDEDRAAFPDTMRQRLGAWPRLLALFRTLYEGARHGTLHIPARRGELFDPDRFPFLEGRVDRADAPTPARISDDVVHRVLQGLLMLDRERLSYRSLDVEQIGSVYEKLMGYHVFSARAEAICLKGEGAWTTGVAVVGILPAQREAFLIDACGLAKNDAKKVAAAVKAAKTADEVLDALDAVKKSGTERTAPHHLVLQPGPERRRTSSHYTPRSLSEPVVRRALEPLLGAMGGAPTAAQLLELKICDPAMGSGAFLVEACRFLADQVIAAWSRDPKCVEPPDPQERLMKARRLVAQRCLYGVDKNATAVTLGRLSLWLVTMAADEPFTFVDHALKHGDSLVGLSIDQIRAFHWAPGAQAELFAHVIDKALTEALGQRQAILDKATCETELCALEKERHHGTAESALERARLIADLCVGAWFAASTAKTREVERKRRLELLSGWLGSAGEVPAELRKMQHDLREAERGVPAFHWMLEFPEVFHRLRPDPLDEGSVASAAWVDAFVGNPPFMGGRGISGAFGDQYADWLSSVHDTGKAADLVAHFLRRADVLLGEHGTMGFVATKTVAQGDTREAGVKPLLARGLVLYDAVSLMKWPGEKDAAVSIAIVHLAKGRLALLPGVGCRLDGRDVSAISSRLRAGLEGADPVRLRANEGMSFMGSLVLGTSFIVTPTERDRLLAKNSKNAQRLFPFLGGDEVNTSPTHAFDRYVIDFGDMTLQDAKMWPDLLSLVELGRKDREKPAYRDHPWWQFWRRRSELYAAIAPLRRCLVTSIVSKHLMFSFQPVGRVFSHKLYVFPIEDHARFAVLQSRVHERWTRTLSSTLEDRLNYSATDCFENFALPPPATLRSASRLESVGKELYERRARLMIERGQGLTVLYNQLKDPAVTDPEVAALRKLHEDVDSAVLSAYGWVDVVVPPFVEPVTSEGRRILAAFEDATIDRLFALNVQRAAEESAVPAGGNGTSA